ncbi:hypothetical protein FNU76_05395 [Chitinimonas arctica]|uniref:Uncharacterized protein n=1 Tax=Chitinimonas arctica TaxID=2594795 RepID=A0A516SCF6_9NEIS|nr:hypothetical protein [Chitinimonas arctica]QDQ25832.1 hypothetical protein FNU76_05395 [Chitinimonas arctica]
MFKIYLRDENQLITEKTTTFDPQTAFAAFEALVNRTDLDEQQVRAILLKEGVPLAHHKFDAPPSDPIFFWRGRIDKLRRGGSVHGLGTVVLDT